MEHARRLLRAINWVYIFYAVAAVSLLYAFTTPVIIDPLIGFLLAGIVPGTDIVLSPETLLLILTDAFGLALCVMLIVWLIQHRLTADIDYSQVADASARPVDYDGGLSKVLRHVLAAAAMRKTARQSTKASQSQAGGTVLPIIRHSTTHAIDTPVRQFTRNKVPAFVAAVAQLCMGVARFVVGTAVLVARSAKLLLYLFVEALYQASVLLIKLLRLAGKGITWAFVFCIVLLGTAIDQIIRFISYAWTRSKPGLRKFDHWLELRYREIGTFILKKLRRIEILQVIVAVIRASISDLRRLFIK